MITIKLSTDLYQAASITLENMRKFYEKYKVDWNVEQIAGMTRTLNNYDLYLNDNLVGIMRISFDNQQCQLRDLQIIEGYKNQGCGGQAILLATKLAKQNHCHGLELKVFQCSPAVRLYLRNGFVIQRSDERFHYMSYTF
ncbi:GCN5-related N-acetyltransferase [Pseudoalteromonas luteoviolacea B = ATCC 29581]|nr:GCN5-related N-acetyltransferase [Pseudoalteromonas luteoviolacea B = ATCC 29581]